MPEHTRIFSANIKTATDFYFSIATVHFYTSGDIEYCAYIDDGSRPKPYIDRATLAPVHPRGHSKMILRPAASWADALEQLQALADEYGTLERGAGIIPMTTPGSPTSDSKDDD